VSFFYAGNRGFCAVYTARRVAPEPPVSVLDASLCVQARSLSLLYESTSSHHKETIILIRKISVLWLFYCKIRVFCPFSLIF